jgi:hypothetical protein
MAKDPIGDHWMIDQTGINSLFCPAMKRTQSSSPEAPSLKKPRAESPEPQMDDKWTKVEKRKAKKNKKSKMKRDVCTHCSCLTPTHVLVPSFLVFLCYR